MREAHKNVEDFASDPDFRNWVLNPDPQQNYYWENWIKEHPEVKGAIQEARVIVLTFYNKNARMNSWEDMRLWDRIKKSVSNIDEKEHSGGGHLVVNFPGESRYTTLNRRIRLLTGIAASLVGVFILFYTFYDEIKLNLQSVKEEQTAPPKTITKSVVKGQKLKMFLSDGSIVHLNASSKLQYKEHFSEDKRVVVLEGEAFFDVKKDPSRPFIVKCKDFETKVLGTTFNVRSYPDDKTTSVALLSGKVQVRNLKKQEEVTLEPGEQADLNIETGEIIAGKVKNPLELQWKDGVLAFKQEPLYKVFEKLELWYGVEFIIDGLSCQEKVTGVFKNEYLSNVLQSLRYTVNFEFKIDNEKVYVKKQI